MTSAARRRRSNKHGLQRRKWCAEHPFCYWCRRPVRLDAPEGADDQATIDHLRPRGDPTRHDLNPFSIWRRVLACYACNKKRNQEFTARLSLEEKWRASGQWMRMVKLTGALNEVQA